MSMEYGKEETNNNERAGVCKPLTATLSIHIIKY